MGVEQSPQEIFEILSEGERGPARLPFSAEDVTAGSESELQAVVVGAKSAVDLPQVIEQSNYYANLMRRIAAGDSPRRIAANLERYLTQNRDGAWENSWVRFPEERLSPFARQTLQMDLLADKRDHVKGDRRDRERFFLEQSGEPWIRVPISYLLKLALADVVGSQADLPVCIRKTGVRVMAHFLNDNTSPETYSFHIVTMRPRNGMGRRVAHETAKRYLLSQLLAMYANRRFGLEASGQKAMVYYAPHPPVRQKQLNDSISDAFYRELMMSPCLSGWDDGEAKQEYMHLCHQVLSRSQLNAVAKLREAGIIVNNLVVLPNVSNISLANNGIHVSLGSHRMTRARREGRAGFGPAEEKHVGDLTIKFVEHFLPLFVGTYTAAPYRLDFADFHPEKVLGFLPHELDYTHLRMLWRRWRGKANLKIFGYPMTPCGPHWLDRALSTIFRLKGDWVVDFRLLDYLAALMSTDSSPALDGRLGNGDRLKRDLAAHGVFDERMSTYLLYRLREFAVMGFSGFEGRYYSLFESLEADMSRAVDLQTLVTALAFKYQAEGGLAHEWIPDDPFVESERRQIFFAAAIGLPTFYVRRETPNRFLQAVLRRTTKTRTSRRYPGYLRVKLSDYRGALVCLLNEEAEELIEMFGMRETMADLAMRLRAPAECAASGRLLQGILPQGTSPAPMRMTGEEFNLAAERYYRTGLRERHLAEGFAFLREDLRGIERGEGGASESEEARPALRHCFGDRDAIGQVDLLQRDALRDVIREEELRALINAVLLSIWRDQRMAEEEQHEGEGRRAAASVH